MFSENMQLIDEEIDIKDEPLFPLSENDKVGWNILDIFELFIGSDGSLALYLRSVVVAVVFLFLFGSAIFDRWKMCSHRSERYNNYSLN